LLVYAGPDEFRRTMLDFVAYYNHSRYHQAIRKRHRQDR
jgi:hypothetical protein